MHSVAHAPPRITHHGRHPRQQTPSTPRWLTRLAWLSVGLAVVVCFGLYPLAGGDLWMHLTVGKWIWAHGWVPTTDLFSYVSAGQPFIAHSWLAELVFYVLEQHTGTAGLMALRFALIAVALGCVLAVARLLKAPWPALVLLAPWVLGLMWGRLEFRPQLFTSAFLALELYLLISVNTGRRSWCWLWVLPPVYALWINLHGGWAEGVVLLLTILGARVGMACRRRSLGEASTRQLPWPHLALVLGVCVGALCLNPYGARLVLFPLEMQQGWIRAATPEWRSPFTFRLSWFTPVWLGYLTMLAGVLYTHVKRWRTADLVPVGLMGLWLALALWHLRAVSDAVLLTSPLVAAALPAAWWKGKQWPLLVGSSLTLGLLVMALCSAGVGWSGFHWNRDEPTCVLASVARLGPPRRMFTDLLNDRLLFRFHPPVLVTDYWEYVMGQERWHELIDTWKGGAAGIQAHLERYQVDAVLLGHRFRTLVPPLVAQGWRLVHLDDRYWLMVREALGLSAYDLIRPWTNAPVTPGNASRVLQEATHALQQCPDGATFAWAYKAEALRLMGRSEESFEARLKVPAELRLE